jgi:multicomponent Na+:H+ antiporter subunit C
VEPLLAGAIGVLVAAATFLLLQGRAYTLILGLLLLSHGANLFVLAAGDVVLGELPILGETATVPDPIPQALVLTAIVINFGLTTFVVVLVIRAAIELGSERLGRDDESHEP